jgi:pyrroloquinoline quinone biosynthesis protein B
MREADLLLVDGTLWTGDEMIRLGLSKKTGADMGHLPQSGAGAMIETLDSLGAKRKVLIHINNTNPILIEDGPERRMLGEHGIEVAYDGMSFEL